MYDSSDTIAIHFSLVLSLESQMSGEVLLQAVIEGPSILPSCGSTIFNIWLPSFSICFSALSLKGWEHGGLLQAWKQTTLLLTLNGWELIIQIDSQVQLLGPSQVVPSNNSSAPQERIKNLWRTASHPYNTI